MMFSKEKRLSPSILMDNASIQIKNCIASLSMMSSIVFGALVQQVWPPLSYYIKYMEVSTGVVGPSPFLEKGIFSSL